MKSSRCPLCRARTARRSCPALGQEICAACCGSKRLVEIRCPDTCGYLRSARSHPAAAVRRRDERELLFFASGLRGTTEQQRAIFALLQTAIVEHARSAMPALVDRDVADAAAALASTFETASRGIIYEQQPAAPAAQRLAAALRARIEQALRPAERPVDRDLAIALRCTQSMAARAAETLEGNASAYLACLERKIAGAPERAREESAPRLIVPGA